MYAIDVVALRDGLCANSFVGVKEKRKFTFAVCGITHLSFYFHVFFYLLSS